MRATALARALEGDSEDFSSESEYSEDEEETVVRVLKSKYEDGEIVYMLESKKGTKIKRANKRSWQFSREEKEALSRWEAEKKEARQVKPKKVKPVATRAPQAAKDKVRKSTHFLNRDLTLQKGKQWNMFDTSVFFTEINDQQVHTARAQKNVSIPTKTGKLNSQRSESLTQRCVRSIANFIELFDESEFRENVPMTFKRKIFLELVLTQCLAEQNIASLLDRELTTLDLSLCDYLPSARSLRSLRASLTLQA
jgi:hypothetical protein